MPAFSYVGHGAAFRRAGVLSCVGGHRKRADGRIPGAYGYPADNHTYRHRGGARLGHWVRGQTQPMDTCRAAC